MLYAILDTVYTALIPYHINEAGDLYKHSSDDSNHFGVVFEEKNTARNYMLAEMALAKKKHHSLFKNRDIKEFKIITLSY